MIRLTFSLQIVYCFIWNKLHKCILIQQFVRFVVFSWDRVSCVYYDYVTRCPRRHNPWWKLIQLTLWPWNVYWKLYDVTHRLIFAVWFSGLETWTFESRAWKCKLWNQPLTITNCPHYGKKTRWVPLNAKDHVFTDNIVNIMKIWNVIEVRATVLFKAFGCPIV